MRLTRLRYNKMAFAIAVIGTVSAVQAGDLDPPPGPIGPTGRFGPRTEVTVTRTPGDDDSLFKITQPGSYYLAGNITGVSGKHGIEIAANGVTLDLMGFEVAGVAESLDGVSAAPGVTNIMVLNGTVRAWGQDGVDLSTATGGRVQGIQSTGNATRGIRVLDGFIVKGCTTRGNGGHGISAQSGNTITQCTASANPGGAGITALGGGNTITGCVAVGNGGRGIECAEGCAIARCSAFQNGSDGFYDNGSSTVVDCSAWGNSGSGIYSGGPHSTIAGCSVSANTQEGVYSSWGGIVLNNVCANNGRAGIRLSGGNHRVEANNVSENARGIDARDGHHSIIIKNSASGNTTANYDIAASNHYGQIVTNPGPNFSNSNPWANFAFP